MPYTPEIGESPSLNEVRSALEGAAHTLIELQRTEPEKRSAEWQEDVASTRGFIQTYDSVATALEHAERTPLAPESNGPTAAFLTGLGQNLTRGQEVTESAAYKDWVTAGARSQDFPQVEVRTLLDSSGSDNAALLRPVGSPELHTQNVQQRRLFVRDIITTQETGLASVPYIRELNSATNAAGASATAEGAAKNEQVMEFEQDDAPARKLTAWIPATTEILADAPTLRGYIDTRLTYSIKLREEAQVLNGGGGSINLKGIRRFTGLETEAGVTADIPAGVGNSIAKIEENDGQASACAFNPIDYWKAVVSRHSTQLDNGFGGNAPAVMSSITWGLPVVRTNSMEAGKALVGDFVLGATLYDREAITVRSSDSHDDYFIKNKVAIVAEERIALAVYRPDWFCELTVAFA
jgi:HK97 family phage major capsid protein